MTDPLLALARDTLKRDVLPHLPPDRLYPALMALTAIGYASRRTDGRLAHAALAPRAPGTSDLAAAKVHIAASLRAEPRRADPALHATLLAATRAECLETNPKARALGGLPTE